MDHSTHPPGRGKGEGLNLGRCSLDAGTQKACSESNSITGGEDAKITSGDGLRLRCCGGWMPVGASDHFRYGQIRGRWFVEWHL